MASRRRTALIALAVLASLAGAGCGGGGGETDQVRSAAGTQAPGTQAPGTTAAVPPSVSSSAPTPETTTAAAQPAPAAAPTVAPSPVDQLAGVGSAGQVISVIADDYGQTTATFTAYERDGSGWKQVFGPWTANLGSRGFAPPGEKHEGDNRTPSGAYGFDFAFGVLADPGVKLPYRPVSSGAIVWDDDPTSPSYNQWIDSSTASAGNDPEPMYNQPAYNYGAVIAYNTNATPGLGSAIFLHVTKGGSTAGCVAITQDQLVDVLRWLDPAQKPRIVMGTRAAVTP